MTARPARGRRTRRLATSGDVHLELLALHWSSDGQGATVPELGAALRLRGVDGSIVAVSDILAGALWAQSTARFRSWRGPTRSIRWIVWEPVDESTGGGDAA